jgi:hypothetical protein
MSGDNLTRLFSNTLNMLQSQGLFSSTNTYTYAALVSGSSTKLYRLNATTLVQLSDFVSGGSDLINSITTFGNGVAFVGGVSGSRSFYYVDDASGTIRQIRDLRAGDDYSSSILPLLAAYNNALYFCGYNSSGIVTYYRYDGFYLDTLTTGIGCGTASTFPNRLAIVDNALWTTSGQTLIRICDSSAGCSP